MNILVPLNRTDAINPLIDAGADEFYFGFRDDLWTKAFGHSDLNRMSSFGMHANTFSFEDALAVISSIKDAGRKAFVTLNANYYTLEQACFLRERYFSQLRDSGLDGIIVSDARLAEATAYYGMSPVASTMCAVYNTDIAQYWASIGVERILPRDVSLRDIETICCTFPDIDFEAFYMRNGCVFSDSHCLGMHDPGCGSICSFLRKSKPLVRTLNTSFDALSEINWNNQLYNTVFHREACGLCATWRLLNAGIKSLKIVGRADDWKSVCQDVKTAKQNIEIAQSSESEADFLHSMIIPANHESRCVQGLNCYYPEVRFSEDYPCI